MWMLPMKLFNQLLRVFEVFSWFPAGTDVTVAGTLYKEVQFPVVSLRIMNLIDFPFVKVVNDRRLWFRWWLADCKRCIAVEQRDMKDVVLPDCMWKV
jgi:hypothetical protein